MKSLIPTAGIACACFLAFMLGMWTMQKEQNHDKPVSWRNACSLTDANGSPAIKLAPAEKYAVR